jgi:hypothetical protein
VQRDHGDPHSGRLESDDLGLAAPLERVTSCLQSNELAADRWGNKVKASNSQPDEGGRRDSSHDIALDKRRKGLPCATCTRWGTRPSQRERA